MKTIKEAANEYALAQHGKEPEWQPDRYQTNIDFKAGVEFAQRWIPVEEKRPDRIGDQKYSEKVLIKSIDLATGEELQIDLDWFDFVENMFKDEITLQGLIKVTHWRPIEYK